ncbi:hypothetical protein PRIPAC_73453 [Pristionchus pacificus]|uniref:Uncharacterized protein n=1 Tax=Pristionchus pacificus TaxID=54126 RepID=A0A2A6CZJ9_PRIPA|nr:hypothetical protein PRIPAC_73453 [Pristionchus pacificus]|eukprot:PDM83652.1 hypothetical protein PRIPAC_30139 [Pristionchus pacificus]
MDDTWFVFFLELLYVFIPLLALYSASSLPHRLNRLRHYFNPIDNPINVVPPTVPVAAPVRVRTHIQDLPKLSEIGEIEQHSEETEELHSQRDMGMIGDN